MISFVLFLLIVYLVAVLGVTLPYWYEAGNSQAGDIPTPSWSFRPCVKLWLGAAWSALLLGIAFPLDPIARRIRPPQKDGGDENLPPVLLVHGLYHSPSGWMYLRRHLLKAGFRDIRTVKYSSWKTDIETLTTILDAAVGDMETRCPGRKPILVGHSLGGLLLRNWLASEDNQKRALGAVTLGAPHRGSKMAALAFGALGKSLHPSNPFFKDLAHREAAATIPCVSLVSEGDTMVLPPQNLVPVTRGWDMRLAPYATHAGIMLKGPVMRMVIWELHRIINAAEKQQAETAHDAPAEPVTVASPDDIPGAPSAVMGEPAETAPSKTPAPSETPAPGGDSPNTAATAKVGGSARKSGGNEPKLPARPASNAGGSASARKTRTGKVKK